MSPRGVSYGVERPGQPFNAVTLVDAARGTPRSAHEVLFEGASGVTLAPPSVDAAPSVETAIVIIGLPRGAGLTLVDRDAFVRDGDLAVVEALVDELRRRGCDARLDREGTLALPPRDVAVSLRVSVWLDDIVIRRAPRHVDAQTRIHVWARAADGSARWEDDRSLQVRAGGAPFDVLGALGREAAAQLAKKLVPPRTSASSGALPP